MTRTLIARADYRHEDGSKAILLAYETKCGRHIIRAKRPIHHAIERCTDSNKSASRFWENFDRELKQLGYSLTFGTF